MFAAFVAANTLTAVARADNACTAQSTASVPPIVELYTSEGCSSCPPADRWLSGLKADAGIVALAFHVDYWDRLGWKDRFASAAYTQRQADEQRHNGADFSYTPQVVLDGRDYQRWRAGPSPSSASARPSAIIAASIARVENRYTATIRAPTANAPSQLSAFWAVTEDDHTSAVKAGENDGRTLRHDYVVREYVPVPPWRVSTQDRTLEFIPARPIDPAHPRHVNLVVLDAANGKPLQAVKVGC